MNRRSRLARALAYLPPLVLLRVMARERCRWALQRWHRTRSPEDLQTAQYHARILLDSYSEQRLRVWIDLDELVANLDVERAPLWPPRDPDEDVTPAQGTPQPGPTPECRCGRPARPGRNTCGHPRCLAAYGQGAHVS